MRVPIFVVVRSDNNNQFLGLFTALQDAKDSVKKQYATIGVCTFTPIGSKVVDVTITNTLNTIRIREVVPHAGPEGLEGF